VADFRLPAAARNPISMFGVALASAMAILFLVLFLLDVVGYLTNPYLGLVLFVAVPAAFVLGLLLVPIGMWADARRRARYPDAAPLELPVIDLRRPRHRTVLATVAALTVVNVVILSMAAYGGVHYMETAPFCGTTCHVAMEPQWVAYQAAPHARVACVECHVGPGVPALARSKLAGTRQLFQVVTRSVPRPIPSPETMRPARDTCEHCHWPEKFHGDKVRIIREYADDEQNTESATTLVMHVGGGSAKLGVGTGFHWHMNINNRVEFVAPTGAEDTIPYVKFTDSRGNVKEYFAEGVTPQQMAGRQRQTMDCMDCHNRPAHTFQATPERAVNEAIAQNRIPRELPFVRREAVAAITAEYPDRDEALASIATRLRDFYRSRPNPPATQLVERAIAGTQDAWAGNVFPQMNVKWGTYPNNIGHVDFPGCFRCHDDLHTAKDGTVIPQDCESCHSMSQ